MSSRLRALLAEMADLEKAATPGPWRSGWALVCGKHHRHTPDTCTATEWVEDDHEITTVDGKTNVAGNYGYEEGGIIDASDAALIVALRNNWDKYERILKAAVEYVEAHEDWHTNKNYSKEAFLRMKASRAALVAAVTEAQ